jgi:DNA polymerase III alpha subunit
MSIGLTILNDDVEIFVLDRALEKTEDVRFNLDMIKEMGLKIFTNVRENAGIEYIPLDSVADRLLQYDHVLPY